MTVNFAKPSEVLLRKGVGYRRDTSHRRGWCLSLWWAVKEKRELRYWTHFGPDRGKPTLNH